MDQGSKMKWTSYGMCTFRILRRQQPGKSVPGAGDDMEKLWQGIEKVDHLRNEEQQHCFAEVSQDAHNSKSHPGKVAESVSHKHGRGVPVKKKQKKKNIETTVCFLESILSDERLDIPVVVKKS